MARRERLRLLALAAIVCASPVLLAVTGTFEAIGFASPLFFLLALLLHGRYVGEGVLVRAVRRARARRRRAPRREGSVPRAPRALVVRGGALIAASLAVRPPPAAGALS